MAKGDVLVRMKADVSNYDANIAKARGTLERFKQENLTFGGVLNQSTKSIVAAAAQYASFAAVLGSVASGFSEAISKGMAMSREAEGVSKAFERLNKPGLLDNLRQATHNTVNDLELMKQAVKFDNFNLSLEQMGTFLAFAQQQAKDTGQDVNYLVDSIVTGLGRKSLPILDNLGLSAEEIRNRMEETGDMTTAVAQIIQERMEAAGGYVETASDRAAQAQVKLDNAMKELGDTMNSLTNEGVSLWAELKIGAIDLANTAIKPLIKLFNELASYINGTNVDDILAKHLGEVGQNVDDKGNYINKPADGNWSGFDANSGQWKKGAVPRALYNTVTGQTVLPELSVIGTRKQKKGGKGGNTTNIQTYQAGSLADQQAQVQRLTKLWEESGVAVRDQYLQPLVEAEQKLQQMKDDMSYQKDLAAGKFSGQGAEGFRQAMLGAKSVTETKMNASGPMLLDEKAMKSVLAEVAKQAKKEEKKPLSEGLNQLTSGLSGLQSGFEQLGIDLGDGFGSVVSGLQGITSILMAIQTIVGAIEAISAIDSLIPFAGGGIIKAATGTIVGNSYSGDNMRGIGPGGQLYGLNAGEVVLNRSQVNNLASALTGNGDGGGVYSTPYVQGEMIFLGVNNYLKRSGRGEIVTSKRG